MIQPHELWDANPSVWLAPSTGSDLFLHKIIENQNLERNELSDWVDHVTKQLIEDMPAEDACGGRESRNNHNHSESSMASGEDCAVMGATVSDSQDFRQSKKLKRSNYFDDGANNDNLIPTSSSDVGKSYREDQEQDGFSMIQIRQGETLAVHWLQHSLYDATSLDWKTLRILKELCPHVVTLVEQDIAHGGSFLDRFIGSLHYCSTLFDSLGAYMPHEDRNRHRVEQCLLYKEINNILAIGGPARSGEDKFKSWRGELARSGGFMQVPTSAKSMVQVQQILNMFLAAQGYNLSQGDGMLKLGWKDTSLYTASAWTSSHHCVRR